MVSTKTLGLVLALAVFCAVFAQTDACCCKKKCCCEPDICYHQHCHVVEKPCCPAPCQSPCANPCGLFPAPLFGYGYGHGCGCGCGCGGGCGCGCGCGCKKRCCC